MLNILLPCDHDWRYLPGLYFKSNPQKAKLICVKCNASIFQTVSDDEINRHPRLNRMEGFTLDTPHDQWPKWKDRYGESS